MMTRCSAVHFLSRVSRNFTLVAPHLIEKILLDALFVAHLNRVFGAIALQALEVSTIPTPWLHQDTTTITLYGAYEDEP